jgi:hypothetical protein
LDEHHHLLLVRVSSAQGDAGEAVTVLPVGGLPAAAAAVPRVPPPLCSPIFLDLYGYNIYFCWFDTNSAWIQFGLKVGYFFGPLWILFLLEIYWSAKTYARLK